MLHNTNTNIKFEFEFLFIYLLFLLVVAQSSPHHYEKCCPAKPSQSSSVPCQNVNQKSNSVNVPKCADRPSNTKKEMDAMAKPG